MQMVATDAPLSRRGRRRFGRVRIVCAWALAGGLWLPAPVVRAQNRPTCAQVMSEVNRHVSERRGLRAGAFAVAERLKTDVYWVQRCMAAHGRIPANPMHTDDEDADLLDESVEEGWVVATPGAEPADEIEPPPRERSRRGDARRRRGADDDDEAHRGLILHD